MTDTRVERIQKGPFDVVISPPRSGASYAQFPKVLVDPADLVGLELLGNGVWPGEDRVAKLLAWLKDFVPGALVELGQRGRVVGNGCDEMRVALFRGSFDRTKQGNSESAATVVALDGYLFQKVHACHDRAAEQHVSVEIRKVHGVDYVRSAEGARHDSVAVSHDVHIRPHRVVVLPESVWDALCGWVCDLSCEEGVSFLTIPIGDGRVDWESTFASRDSSSLSTAIVTAMTFAGVASTVEGGADTRGFSLGRSVQRAHWWRALRSATSAHRGTSPVVSGRPAGMRSGTIRVRGAAK